ncbi:ATP-grasp domain-containing protein [Candidatus Woesearchaeota archaeon]|nr:ATP-grasp domain-containing protein [Candidatus Woesearchaeota archaeon]
MKLLVITSHEDDATCDRIVEEAQKKGMEASKLFYEELAEMGSVAGKFDSCVIRYAYSGGKEYSAVLNSIMESFDGKQLLSNEMLDRFPPDGKDFQHPQDKYFQHMFFKDVVRMPKFWHFNSVDEIKIDKFPVVVKERVSEKGRGVFVLESKEEVETFFKDKDINQHFFVEFVNIKKDIRVIVLNYKAVAAVRRNIRFKDNQGYKGIGVKVAEQFEIPEEMAQKAVEVAKKLGIEFCGLDFVIDENDEQYMLECNSSVAFTSTERVLGMNIAESVVDLLIKKSA